jgi:hypothetical protein
VGEFFLGDVQSGAQHPDVASDDVLCVLGIHSRMLGVDARPHQTRYVLPMRSRVLLALIPVVLSVAACGGTKTAPTHALEAQRTAAQEAAKRRAAEESWVSDFRALAASMLPPALGVSTVMGNSLNLVLNGDPATRRRLETHLAALGACSKRLGRLGHVPVRFRRAGETAASACGHLEAGAALVDVGIKAYQRGLGEGLLTRAASSIGKGVELFGTATKRLSVP